MKKVKEQVLSVFLLSFSTVLFVIFIVGVYVFGFSRGYNLSQSDTQNEIDKLAFSIQGIIESQRKNLTSNTNSEENNSQYYAPSAVLWGGPDLWEAVNKRRMELGVNSLNQKDNLCTIASIRLNELLEIGELDGHEGFSTMTDRRPDLKYIFEDYSNVAEFLAYGGRSADETVKLWENTLAHKKLMTGGEYVWGCIYAQDTFAVAIAAY